MFKNIITLTPRNITLISTAVLSAILLYDYYLFAYLAIIVIAFIIFSGTWDTVIFFIIFFLLTLVGELNPSIRLVLQIISLGTLILMFIYEFGLNFKLYPSPPRLLLVFIFSLLGVMLFSTFHSGYIQLGLRKTLETYIVFFLIYLLYSVLNTEARIKIALAALLSSSLIMASSTLYEFITSDFDLLTIFTITNIRVGGLLSNYNALSAFYAISIPILIGLIFIYEKKSLRLFYSLIILFFIFALVLTGSRASFTSLFVSVLFITAFLKRKIFYISLFIIIFFIAIYFLIPAINENISVLLRVQQGLSQRDYLWQVSIEMIKNNFFTGIGPGTWGIKMYNYYPIMLDTYTSRTFAELILMTSNQINLSHNVYLAFFSEIGVFGFLLSLLLPVIYMHIGIITIGRFRNVHREYYIISIVLTAIGLGLFIRGVFEAINIVSFGWITADLPFWLIFIYLIFLNKSSLRTKNYPQV